MLPIEKNVLWFKTAEIYFADEPTDIPGYDHIQYRYCKKNGSYDGFKQTKDDTLLIDLDASTDTLFSQMKKNTRNHIRSAEKKGIQIKQSTDFTPFYDMYVSLFKQKGLTSLGNKVGIGKLISKSSLERYGTLFYAYYHDDIIVGDVYLEGDDTVFSWAGASKRLHVDKEMKKIISRAERLCVWRALVYYKDQGKHIFDMGGMWPEKEAKNNPMKHGINSYKKGFGGTIKTYYSYQKTYSLLYTFLSTLHK